MQALTALAVIAILAAAQATSQWTVLSAPASVKYSTSAAAPSLEQITAITADALGVPTSQGANWNGLASANMFRRPRAAVTIVFNGLIESIAVDNSVATYTITDDECAHECPMGCAVTDNGVSVASLVAAAFPDAQSLSMSRCANGVKAAKSSSPKAEGITWNQATNSFDDSNGGHVVSEAQIRDLFSHQTLGNGIRFDAASNAFLVSMPNGRTVTLSLDVAEISSLMTELFAMQFYVRTVSVSGNGPFVGTLLVAKSRALMQSDAITADVKSAVMVVLSRFAATINAEIARVFNGQAIVQVVSVNTVVPSFISTLLSTRMRQTPSKAGIPTINGGLPIMDSTFDFADVPFCSNYTYYCNQDKNGVAWNPSTGCSVSCPNVTSCTDCVWYGCANTSAGVMPGLQVCNTCQTNFVLLDGYCYVDSIYPATFNIVLWLGVAVALALIATCYTIGSIDPGKNTAIYRTGSHAKSK